MKVWDRAGIELAIPGSAVRLASVARHVTDCATRSGRSLHMKFEFDWAMCENYVLILMGLQYERLS